MAILNVLVVNAGSGSLKLSVLDGDDEVVAGHTVDGWDGSDPGEAIDMVLAGPAGEIDAVGHRVVHGGPDLTQPVLVDDEVVARLASLSDLAPLHQPRSLAALEGARSRLDAVPHVACFDTAFHATLPEAAATWALPAEWRSLGPVRRFGFHGLSHAWAARRGPEVAGIRGPAARRIVSCHLGSGASACAIEDGRSIDTTMGFTPLDGLVMNTRPGAVDPGLLVWLVDHGVSIDELREGLNHRSGLAGLTGGDGDIRHVLRDLDDGRPEARLALDVYAHRLAGSIAAMVAALGGVDLLVLTGAVATHQPRVRALAAASLAHLGLELDARRNDAASGDSLVSADGSTPLVTIRSREDVEIAQGVRGALGAEAH